MANREEDHLEKMKSLLVQAIELTKKADKTDDEDLESEYMDKARELYQEYELMKLENQASENIDSQDHLRALGIDHAIISEIYALSRLLGVSMSKATRVFLSAGVNHSMKLAFRYPEKGDAGQKLDFMQIAGVSPEAVRKALKKMTPDEV